MRGQQFIIAKIDGDQHGQYQGLSEGSSVGQFEGLNGNMLDLFISYQAGDGNDIPRITLLLLTVPRRSTALEMEILV